MSGSRGDGWEMDDGGGASGNAWCLRECSAESDTKYWYKKGQIQGKLMKNVAQY